MKFLEMVKEAHIWARAGRPLGTSRVVLDRWNVFVSDQACMALLGAPHHIPFAMTVPMVVDGTYAVGYVVNNKFFEQPEWWQRCALRHEEGHFMLGHAAKVRWYTSVLRLIREDQMELDADKYASNLEGREVYVKFLKLYATFGARHMAYRIAKVVA